MIARPRPLGLGSLVLGDCQDYSLRVSSGEIVYEIPCFIRGQDRVAITNDNQTHRFKYLLRP